MSRVTRSQVVSLSAFVGRLFVAMAITAVAGRALSPDDFGFFTLIGTCFVVVHLVIDLGTREAAGREIARDWGQERRVLEGLLGWRLLAALVVAGVIMTAAGWEPRSERRWIWWGMAATALVMAWSGLTVVFQVRQIVGRPALVRFSHQGMVLGGAAAVLILDLPAVCFAGLLVLRELLNAVWFQGLAVRVLGQRPRPALRERGLGPFLRSAWIQGVARLLHIGHFPASVLLVSLLGDAGELGRYSAAFRPANAVLVVPWLLLMPFLPVLAARLGEEPERFRSAARSAAALLSGGAVLVGAAGWMLAPDVLEVLYQDHYARAPEVIDALRWLMVGLAGTFLAATSSSILLAQRREKELLVFALARAVLQVAGYLILVPRAGLVGAAVATAASEWIIALVMMRRVPGIWASPLVVVPGAVVGALLFLLPGAPWVRLLVGAGLCILAAFCLFRSSAVRRSRE